MSIQPHEGAESVSGTPRDRRAARSVFAIAMSALILLLAGAMYLGYSVLERLQGMEDRIAELSAKATEASETSQSALHRAEQAEQRARDAATSRALAEADSQRAREDEQEAREDAESARQVADEAVAEAERIRKEAEAELNRLHEALGQIAETRRTALGLVMNLGSDALKFDFDKADLKPENRELLSRIAGILMASSQDYTITVNGHTDYIGSEGYNQELSERRAETVRHYLIEAGLPNDLMTVKGWGKSQPLVPGESDAARAKNRRVEIGIVNARVRYRDGREASTAETRDSKARR
jgi:outer membrane protein OmpA-like peptidoglycan-associated protein